MDHLTLDKIIRMLASFNEDDEMVIHMRKPWSFFSECMVVPSAEGGRAVQAGFDYFLEVSVALEVLEGYAEHHFSVEEQCERLLFYAENDAFLD